ncbi:MAG: glutathione metabolism protein [Moraxellaceae bacterium]|nr:MAG: glutathione metabolism protein [Moraxellaceae bacterium]
MLIVGFYAASLALLYLVLTFRTIFLRGKLRVALGDGKQEPLQRAIRVHANFNEYVPLGLILLFLVASSGSPILLLHGLGVALLLGRLLHALGVSRSPEPLILRQLGMVLTIGSILVSAGFLLVRSITSVAGL